VPVPALGLPGGVIACQALRSSACGDMPFQNKMKLHLKETSQSEQLIPQRVISGFDLH
jgi:hypothetical protein